MKRLIRVYLALFVLLMSSTSVWALRGGAAYAVLNGNTLTFKFEYEQHMLGDNEWDVSNTGTEQPWSSQAGNITKVVFDPSFADARPTSCQKWFYGCEKLTSIEGIEYLNTSEVTNMFEMFYKCRGLTSIDVSHFNTSNLQSMSQMFNECNNLTTIEGLENLNTSNVTNMNYMFWSCKKLESLDLSHFNTEKVKDMEGMFWGCSSLQSLDLSHFNTSNVTDMSGMFYNCSKLTSLDLSHFNTEKVTDMGGLFRGCDNLRSLDLSHFNTSNVTDMRWMFYDCGKLTSLDLSGFNTSNVENMCAMFLGCKGLTSLDLRGFNTEKVENIGWMFQDCTGLTKLDLSNFNTGNVTTIQEIFYGCTNLEFLNVSSFNTSKVKSMYKMFCDCKKLPFLDLSSFNTDKVQTMNQMFSGCSSLAYLTIGKDFTIHETSNNGDTADKTYTVDMFVGCTALENGTLILTGAPEIDDSQTTFFSAFKNGTLIADHNTLGDFYVDGEGNCMGGKFSSIGDGTAYASYSDGTLTFKYGVFTPDNETSWDVNTGQPWSSEVGNITKVVFDPSFAAARPKSCFYWFSRCENLKTIDGIENLNTSNVTTMAGMFYGCGSLTSLDVSHFNTSQVTNMFQMFYNCKGLTSLDVSHFNTGNVTSMQYMFQDCRNLKDLDLSNFNTSKVDNMELMFADCRALTGLNVSSFNTSNVTDMSMMFYGCWELMSLDVSNFNTSKVKNMAQMFNGCSKLESLDVSNFDTGKVTRMDDMFQSCSRLLRIEVGSFNTSQVIRMEDMFRGCDNLTYLDLSSFNTSQVTSMKQMFEGCINLERLSIGEDFNVGSTTDTENMFKNCTALADGQLIVMVNNASNSNAPTIEQDIFNNVFKNGTLITNIDLGATQSGEHYTWHGGTFKSVGGVDVDYLDKDGKKQTATNALPITAGCSELPAGWYYVGDDVLINHTLTFTGDAHLILCDDATLTINVTGTDNGVFLDTHKLTIYAQSSGDHAGRLTINSDYKGIEGNTLSSAVTINGGTITVNTKGEYGIFCDEFTLNGGALTVNAPGSDACGILAYDNFTLNGGKLSVTGTNRGIYSIDVAINGGKLSATAGEYGIYGIGVAINGGQVTASGGTYGIYAGTYNITLGWTNASDYIYATSYGFTTSSGTVNIKAGQSFAYDNQTISGNDVDKAAIANKTLIPASSFAGGTGVTKYVALSSDNGDWNITDTNTKVYVPTGNIVPNGTAYEMELREVTGSGIPSGVPVILYNATMPANVPVVGAQGDEINVIENNYQAANPSPAFFMSDGTKTLNELIQGALGTSVDPNEYVAFVLINDKLVMASNSGTPVAAGKFIFVFSKFAVLQMIRGTYNSPVTSAPGLGIPFSLGDDNTTGVVPIHNSQFTIHNEVDEWFTLNGRKLNKAPAAKGVYINNGKKIIIK